MQTILGQGSQVQAMPDHSQGDFLSCVVGPLLRCTKSIRKLKKSIGYLADEYWRPVLEGEVKAKNSISKVVASWYMFEEFVPAGVLLGV